MEYIAYLHKDKGSDYGVSFPDFPGAITAGSTLEEARRMAGEILPLHIAGKRGGGEKIPAPSTLGEVRNQPPVTESRTSVIQTRPPGKALSSHSTPPRNH